MRVKFKPWNWGFEEVSGTSLRGFVKKCTSDCGRAGCRITRLNIFFSCCFIPDFVLQIFYLSNDDYFIFIKKVTKITMWQKQSRDVPSKIVFSCFFWVKHFIRNMLLCACFIGFVGNMCCKTGKTSETENRKAPKQNVGREAGRQPVSQPRCGGRQEGTKSRSGICTFVNPCFAFE